MKKLTEIRCDEEHRFYLAILPMPILAFAELMATITCPFCRSKELFLIAERKHERGGNSEN